MDHGVNIVANETWFIADAPHNITASFAISDGVTVTIEIGNGQSIVFNGNFTITINGKITGNATSSPINVTPSVFTTRGIGTFLFNADDGSAIVHWRMLGAGRFEFSAAFTGTPDLDYLLFQDLIIPITQIAGAADPLLGKVECRHCGGAVGGSGVITVGAGAGLTADVIVLDHCTAETGASALIALAGSLTCPKLVIQNSHCGRGIYNTANANTLTVAQLLLYDCDANNFAMVQAAAGTLTPVIADGIANNVTDEVAFNTGAGVTGNFTMEVSGLGSIAGLFAFESTVKVLNCSVAGHTGRSIFEFDTTANTGVEDGVQTSDGTQINNVDRIEGLMATRKHAPAFSGVSVSAITSESASFNFTPSCPCQVDVLVSEISGFSDDGTVVASAGGVWLAHYLGESEYLAMNVVAVLDAILAPSTTYFYRLRGTTPNGETFFFGNGTDTFTTLAAPGGGFGPPTTTPGMNPMVITVASLSNQISHLASIIGFYFYGDTAGDVVEIQDENGNTVLQARTTAEKSYVFLPFKYPFAMSGLKVPVLSAGSALYVYYK